jgi:hypothetical protein
MNSALSEVERLLLTVADIATCRATRDDEQAVSIATAAPERPCTNERRPAATLRAPPVAVKGEIGTFRRLSNV